MGIMSVFKQSNHKKSLSQKTPTRFLPFSELVALFVAWDKQEPTIVTTPFEHFHVCEARSINNHSLHLQPSRLSFRYQPTNDQTNQPDHRDY